MLEHMCKAFWIDSCLLYLHWDTNLVETLSSLSAKSNHDVQVRAAASESTRLFCLRGCDEALLEASASSVRNMHGSWTWSERIRSFLGKSKLIITTIISCKIEIAVWEKCIQPQRLAKTPAEKALKLKFMGVAGVEYVTLPVWIWHSEVEAYLITKAWA